jgi:hypothetical protein
MEKCVFDASTLQVGIDIGGSLAKICILVPEKYYSDFNEINCIEDLTS